MIRPSNDEPKRNYLANFRANVRYLLTPRGAYRELSEAAGISRSYLTRSLQGPDEPYSQIPTLETCGAIANALGVPLGALTDTPPEEFRMNWDFYN